MLHTSVVHQRFRTKQFSQFLVVIAALLSVFSFSATGAIPTNVAFYYGSEAPVGRLMSFDWVVMQQDRSTNARLDILNESGTVPIAYVSVGEMARTHRFFERLRPDWQIGKNPAWSSAVLDLRLQEVTDFLLEQLIDPAFDRGFRGVFLDTLDSFLLAVGESETPAFAEAQQQLIQAIRSRHPEAKIILNRGFHLPDNTAGMIDAIALESWRQGYNAGRKTYYQVSESDRHWLRGQLDRWRTLRPDLPVIAIDYVAKADDAQPLADRLRSEGFIPWAANPELTRLSPTNPATVNRHVLMFHNLLVANTDLSFAHRYGGIILERLGYIPDYQSTRQPLPTEPVADRYAGIVTWLEIGDRNRDLCQWLARQQATGVPVVMLGLIPDEPECNSVLSADKSAKPALPLSYRKVHPSVGQYEGTRLPTLTERALYQPVGHTPWLTVKDSHGESFSPVYTHDKGGVAAAPFLFEPGPENEFYWLFDPFEFFRRALGHGGWPIIDTTTDSGRRILTAHIDGDGFVSRAEFAGSPLSAEVIRDEILNQYSIPHTVSVIEADVSPDGLYPQVSTEAESLARNIFKMDSVEVASHTYSRPFFWNAMEGGTLPSVDDTRYVYSMNIPGYQPSLDREIDGSVNYINQRLAPSGKPVSLFLWTGDARPGPDALRQVRKAGLLNVNGGNTKPLSFSSELTATWPDGRPVGDELQVYAPVMNENIYTGLWTKPFYGYRNVMDTFRVLENRGRLKPMSIYYHFYSGSKPEALGALREVYDYALSRPVTPLPLSEYANRVRNFYYSAMVRHEDGSWSWRGIGQPRTLVISKQHYPDMNRSEGVAGFHDAAGKRYVHLSGPTPRLMTTEQPPNSPWLGSANASVTQWAREQTGKGWRISIGLEGYQPVRFKLYGVSHCESAGRTFSGSRSGDGLANMGTVELAFDQQRIEALTLECH